MDNWNRREALGNRKKERNQPSTPLIRIAPSSKIAATPHAANSIDTFTTASKRMRRRHAEDAALLRAECAGGNRLAANVAHRFEQKGARRRK
jgi:hypothetical protein